MRKENHFCIISPRPALLGQRQPADGSRQAALACGCPWVGITEIFPTPTGARRSERSWACGCLGGIQLLAESARKAQGQIHLQVNPF